MSLRNSEQLAHLRAMLRETSSCVEQTMFAAPELEIGIPSGSLVEITGPAKTEWLCRFLNLHPNLQIYWAEQYPRLLPTALYQRGIHFNRVTFAHLGNHLHAGLRQAAQNSSFQVLVAPNIFASVKEYQTLRLFAQKTRTVIFLLGREKPVTAWPISLQIEAFFDAQQDHCCITVHKQKYGHH